MEKKRSAKLAVLACIEAVKNNPLRLPNRQALQVFVGCGTRATKVLWEMGVISRKDGFLQLASEVPSINVIMKIYYKEALPVPKATQLELSLPESQEQKLLGLIRSVASKLPEGTTIQIRCNGAWQIKSDGF